MIKNLPFIFIYSGIMFLIINLFDIQSFRDNINYYYLYINNKDSDIFQSFIRAAGIGLIEPTSAFIFSIFPKLLSWEIFFFMKGLLIYTLAFTWIKRSLGSNFLALLFVAGSFYIFVLALDLHGLSISIIFLIAFLLQEKRYFKITFLLLALTSHLQSTVLFFAKIAQDFLTKLNLEKVKLISIMQIIFVLAFLFFLIFSFASQQFNKYFDFYFIDFLIAIIYLVIVYIIFSNKDNNLLIFMLFISFAILLFGGSRLNLFLYFAPFAFLNPGQLRKYALCIFPLNFYMFFNFIQKYQDFIG